MATVNREREFLKFLMRKGFLGAWIITRPEHSMQDRKHTFGWWLFKDFADVVNSIQQEIKNEPALPAVCPIITEDGEG